MFTVRYRTYASSPHAVSAYASECLYLSLRALLSRTESRWPASQDARCLAELTRRTSRPRRRERALPRASRRISAGYMNIRSAAPIEAASAVSDALVGRRAVRSSSQWQWPGSPRGHGRPRAGARHGAAHRPPRGGNGERATIGRSPCFPSRAGALKALIHVNSARGSTGYLGSVDWPSRFSGGRDVVGPHPFPPSEAMRLAVGDGSPFVPARPTLTQDHLHAALPRRTWGPDRRKVRHAPRRGTCGGRESAASGGAPLQPRPHCRYSTAAIACPPRHGGEATEAA